MKINNQLWQISLVTIFLGLLACSGDEKREKNEAPPIAEDPSQVETPQEPPELGSDDVSGGSGSPARTMQQCNSEGKAWIAVVNGSHGTCGGPLASWGCCRAQIVARFPISTPDLANKIDENIGDQFQLYNCEAVSDTEHRIHFVKYPGGGKVEYRNIVIPGLGSEPSSSVENCPQIPGVEGDEGEEENEGDGEEEGDGGEEENEGETEGDDEGEGDD